jgi:hypothetical protein
MSKSFDLMNPNRVDELIHVPEWNRFTASTTVELLADIGISDDQITSLSSATVRSQSTR